jgi:hypothetical protein
MAQKSCPLEAAKFQSFRAAFNNASRAATSSPPNSVSMFPRNRRQLGCLSSAPGRFGCSAAESISSTGSNQPVLGLRNVRIVRDVKHVQRRPVGRCIRAVARYVSTGREPRFHLVVTANASSSSANASDQIGEFVNVQSRLSIWTSIRRAVLLRHDFCFS